jgi:two-component system, NarL family, nitrate/nitrite response regulator NarL
MTVARPTIHFLEGLLPTLPSLSRHPSRVLPASAKGRAVRILIVDDHALFRAGIVLLLSRLDPEVEVVEVGSVEDAFALARPTPPAFDLVLLDLTLRGTTGLDSVRAMRETFPGSAVVILSGIESPDAMREARAKGAQGYIVKAVSADSMLASLRTVLSGHTHFPLIKIAGTGEAKLTPRQLEILRLLCVGRTNKEIAAELRMSDNTVRSHLLFVFRALGVRTRTEAALAARRMGLV